MAEAGKPEVALTLTDHQNRLTDKNASIQSGMAGTVLSYLSLCQYGINVRFIRELLANSGEALSDSDIYMDGSKTETGDVVGLFNDGYGVAVICEAAFRRTRDIDWHRHAEALLEQDVYRLKASSQGTQYVDMSGVSYGYLSGGLVEMGVAYSIADQARYKKIIKEISMSLGPRLCLSVRLFREGVGLVASLMMIDGTECKSVIEQKLNNLLHMGFFSVNDDGAIYSPGNHSYYSSSDYSTGVVGIALFVGGYYRRGPVGVPWSPHLFDRVGKGNRGGWTSYFSSRPSIFRRTLCRSARRRLAYGTTTATAASASGMADTTIRPLREGLNVHCGAQPLLPEICKWNSSYVVVGCHSLVINQSLPLNQSNSATSVPNSSHGVLGKRRG